MRTLSTLTTVVLSLLPAVACDVAPAPTSPTETPSEALSGVGGTGLSSSAEDHRAHVFIQVPEACGMFDGNGDGVGGQDADVNVFTQSRNGNALHNCHLDVPNDQGHAVRWSPQNNPLGFPFPCFILDGPFGDPGTEVRTTMQWKMTISASGKGKLTCIAR